MWAHMLSALAYKLQSKSGVVKMLMTDERMVRYDGVAARLQSRPWKKIGRDAPFLPPLDFP